MPTSLHSERAMGSDADSTVPTLTEKSDPGLLPEEKSHHHHHPLPDSVIAAEVVPGSRQIPDAETDNSDSDLERNELPREPQDVIPDGGFEAWFQLFASFVVLMDTWGVVNCYGVYQTFYEEGTLFERSSSELAWVGSIQSALLLVVGSVVGPLYDAGHFRIMMRIGVFLIVFGMFMVSFCKTYWQVMLAQGICVGLGCGLTFLPSTAILSQYFKKHLGLAVGISAAGSPIAGIVLPIMFGHLRPKIGFPWATRAIAFILLGLSCIPFFFMKTRITPVKRRRDMALLRSILQDVPFMFATFGMASIFMTMYIPYFYVQGYAIEKGITTSDFSPYLITIISAGSIPGRIIPSYIGDRIGALNVIIFMALAAMILAYSWLSITSLASMVLFCIFYGCANGGLTSGTTSIIVALSPDMSLVGTRMGFLYSISGLCTLIGPPVAGALIGESGVLDWTAGICWAGAGLSFGVILLLCSRYTHWKIHQQTRI